MKCKSPGAARGIIRKSSKGYLKQMERQRELHKMNAELERNALKRQRMEIERGIV
jgi:hypothetical protein